MEAFTGERLQKMGLRKIEVVMGIVEGIRSVLAAERVRSEGASTLRFCIYDGAMVHPGRHHEVLIYDREVSARPTPGLRGDDPIRLPRFVQPGSFVEANQQPQCEQQRGFVDTTAA